MASYDDQKLIDDIKGVLTENGTTPAGQRVVSTLQTYADNPSPTEQNAREVRDNLSSLLQISGVISQEKLLKIAALEAMGMNTFFNGIGPIDTDDRDKRDKRQFDQTVRALAVQALQAEAMRQFNEAMETLDNQIKAENNHINKWLSEKEPLEQQKLQNWEKVDKFQTSGQRRIEQLKLAALDTSPEGKKKADQQIDAAIAESCDYKTLLIRMKEDHQKEKAADEKFIVEHQYRKAEMIESLNTGINAVSDKALKTDLQKIKDELAKDHPDKESIQKLKESVEARAKTLPEQSKDLEKIKKLLDAGEKIGPLFWKVSEQLEKREKQGLLLDELLKKQEEKIKLLQEAKNLPQEARIKIFEEIEYLEQKKKDLYAEQQKTRDIIDDIEKQRLQIVSDRANAAAQKKAESLAEQGYALASGLKDIFGKHVTGGQKRMLANGEEVEVYQASQTKLYYTLDKDNGRVYLSGDNQFKLLNEDGYTAERLKAYREARAIYAPGETTPPMASSFSAAAAPSAPRINLPNVSIDPIIQQLPGP